MSKRTYRPWRHGIDAYAVALPTDSILVDLRRIRVLPGQISALERGE